jgi:tRNA U34 5-carboxymethylaminomethyl modifying GTPase MnmE/TrmE
VPVINKIDLDGPLEPTEVETLTGSAVERACALTGRGVDALRARLSGTLAGTEVPGRDEAVVTLDRVARALDAAASKRDTAPLAAILTDGKTRGNRA